MKELLTSNGLTNSIIEKAFLSLLEKPAEANTVGFIPTAAFGETNDPEWNYLEWLEEYRNQLRRQGITNIEDVDLKDKTEEELEKILFGKDIIFVSGGNTFYLMYYAGESGFDKIVHKFLEKGGIYVGASAGSIAACPVIDSAGWEPGDENRVDLTDLKGLGLVPILIHPHFNETQREDMESKTKQTNYPIIAITDEQAILVNNGEPQVVGEGNENIFR